MAASKDNQEEIRKEYPNKDTQFKPGQSGNPLGKPKGTIHLSTRIQMMLNDPEFVASHVFEGKKLEFKGQPVKAIIQTAVIKAVNGDKSWADWLANNGYGSKVVHSNDPENPIILSNPDLAADFADYLKNKK